MGLFRRSLIISFKEKSIFRFDYLVGTVFAFFYIVLKVSLWKGLYQQCPLKPVFRRVCADLVFPGGTKGAVGISAFPLHCL